jgi:tetratricopeptide (TPR) repeat protein
LKKELRKQIKHDEFLTGVGKSWRWMDSHRDESRITAGVLVGLAIAFGGLAYFKSRRAAEANDAFSQALAIFEGRVAGENPNEPPGPGGTVYASAADKFKKAAAAFDGVERRYGSLPVGMRARYYGALSRIELGDFDAASKALKELAAQKGVPGLEPALARAALAELARRRGQVDQAIEEYGRLADDPSSPLPRDYALMSLASTLEEAHREAEAAKSYRRLAEEFPASVYAAEARKRAEYLKPGA